MKSRLVFFLALAVLLGAAVPAVRGQEADALGWLNRLRSARDLAPLALETALEKAAASYAAVLAAAGRLSHRDAEGGACLERYRAAGGSAARAGEILGAGPDLAAVTVAWEASPAHAAAALDPRWTHAGAGRAQAAGGEYWVVLFAEQRVEGFRLLHQPDGYLVAGSFRDSAAAQAVLLSGLAAVQPAAWDTVRREFRFYLPAEAGRLYHRLGYRTEKGDFTLTSAFYPDLAAEAAAP